MKYAIVFILFGSLAGLGVATADSIPAQLPLGNLGVAFVGVGIGYAGLGARVFLKRPDGRLRLLSYVLFWPYFALNHLSLLGYRVFTKESAFDEIAPGIVLGARLYPRDENALLEQRLAGVLDLTCEFGEVAFLQHSEHYLCIPLLDTTAPSSDELDRGLSWLQERLGEGRVYVHCALGHGRSATFVAALLVANGVEPSAEAAESKIRAMRPRAGLNHGQRVAVEEFAKRATASPDVEVEPA